MSTQVKWALPVLTREGIVMLSLAAVLILVGVAKSINLVALLGYILLSLLLLAWLTVGLRLERVEAHRQLDDAVHVNTVTPVLIRLHNHSGRSCRGVTVEDQGQEWHIDRLAPDGRSNVMFEIVPTRRGWLEFPPLFLSSRHPFGLVRRRVEVAQETPTKILVFPATGRLQRERFRHQLRGADPRGERLRRSGRRHDTARTDFHGLRPFRPGDSPRWIHWRTSARRGELMVREYEDVPGNDLYLVVDPQAEGKELEDVISLAATIIQEWSHAGGDGERLLLKLGDAPTIDGLSGPTHGRLLLEKLALTRRSEREILNYDDDIPLTAAVVVVSGGQSRAVDELERRMGVSAGGVLHLDVRQQQEWDFYTPPSEFNSSQTRGIEVVGADKGATR
jgi:uncharacterized protein (DUF58 family)